VGPGEPQLLVEQAAELPDALALQSQAAQLEPVEWVERSAFQQPERL